MEAIHPGIILKKDFIDHLGLSQFEVAKGLKISYKHLSNILHGRVQITAGVAVRLGIAFNTDPAIWLDMQQAHNISEAKEKLKGTEIKVFVLSFDLPCI